MTITGRHRAELRMDEHGVRVKNTWWTDGVKRVVGWDEVRWLRDGPRLSRRTRWVLEIVLKDGGVVSAQASRSGTASAAPQTLQAIWQAARHHAIPAVLTGRPVERFQPAGGMPEAGLYPDPGGEPGLREWDGTEWSPVLHADPAGAVRDGTGELATAWSPLSKQAQQQHWESAAAALRGRRAIVRALVVLTLILTLIVGWLTVGGLALTVAGVSGGAKAAVWLTDLFLASHPLTLALGPCQDHCSLGAGCSRFTRNAPPGPGTAVRLIHGHLPSQTVSGQQMVGVVMHGMTRFLSRACAVATAGVALSTVAVTGANASSGGGVPAHPGALRPVGLVAGRSGAVWPASKDHAIGRGSAAPINSRYFAGYQAAVTTGSATSSAATFTVPTLACTTANVAITPSVGVDANNLKTYSAAFLFIGCANGKPVYFPGLVSNGAEADYTSTPFSAGDAINLSASVTTSGITVQVTDTTKNISVTNTITGAGASANDAWVGDDAWVTSTGAPFGVPNFAKLKFFNCLIDGTALQSWNPQQYQRVNRKGIVQIATGPFSPAPAAFATYYKHS
jgi:hypothetical protein